MKGIAGKWSAFRKACSFQNLKRNWYFPISAGAFFCLNMRITRASGFGIAVAMAAACVLAAYSKSIREYVRVSRGWTVLSVLSAAGISWGAMDSFSFEDEVLQTDKIKNILNRSAVFDVGRVVCCVAGIAYISLFVMLFWKKMGGLSAWKKDLFSLTRTETAVYAMLFAASCGYVIYAFSGSVAFYDVHPYGFLYDAIYSSDSADLLQPSAYLWPVHAENDIRQPLFALFAAPFMGIPYLISAPFSVPVRAMVTDCAQVAMLLFANLMIAKAMRLKPFYRICFMVLSFCMYSNLLFTVMMEQYIIVYFWLAAVVYMFCRKEYHELPMLAAGGTLLAGFALLPLFPAGRASSFRDALKAWLMRVGKLLLKYVGLMALFCRFDVIYNLLILSRLMLTFTGKGVTFTNRLFQFSEYVRGCFLAPAAGVDFTTRKHVAWLMNPVEGIQILGVVILCLVILSAVINRRKRFALIAGVWAAFSFVVLAVVGWGTKENGLILYALYFGWAYLALLLELVIALCEKAKASFAVGILSAAACGVMLYVNIPAIRDLLRFAFEYYPVI